MKKQIFKIGQKATTIKTCVNTIAGKVYTIGKSNYGSLELNGCTHQDYWILVKPPKKVTKPSKRVVKKQMYDFIGINTTKNGYVICLKQGSDQANNTFVFNTKARLLKWIGEHI